MNLSSNLTPEEDRELKEFVKGVRKNIKERPEVSDEEFMAETEVSDEQYKMGLTLPVPGGTD